MLSQTAQTCVNKPDYVTLHSTVNIMTENSSKLMHNGFKLLLSETIQKRVITSAP